MVLVNFMVGKVSFFVVIIVLFCAHAEARQLPIYLEDSHVGSFGFLRMC